MLSKYGVNEVRKIFMHGQSSADMTIKVLHHISNEAKHKRSKFTRFSEDHGSWLLLKTAWLLGGGVINEQIRRDEF